MTRKKHMTWRERKKLCTSPDCLNMPAAGKDYCRRCWAEMQVEPEPLPKTNIAKPRNPCMYSRTGFAFTDPDGRCSCIPASPLKGATPSPTAPAK